MSSPKFLPATVAPKHAIAASLDVSGFSSFCQRHDAQALLPKYLSAFFQSLHLSLGQIYPVGEHRVWSRRPDFAKFTGDGALLLWLRDSGAEFSPGLRTAIVAALRSFQQQLPRNVATWERQLQVTGLPRVVRVGVATGPVQPLTSEGWTMMDDTVDYVGYCINLAVRLQDHAPDIGFLVHAPISPQIQGIGKLKAVRLKGTADELVWVFFTDYDRFQALHSARTIGQKFRSPN